MRILITILLVLSAQLTKGQAFSYPVLKKTGKSTADFVPPGWSILASDLGDLNADKADDLVLVLQHQDSILSVSEDGDSTIYQPRMLAIFFYDKKTKQYTFIQQSISFILVHDNPYMDEPFQGISISGGVLQIDFFTWYSMGSYYMAATSYKFRYQNGTFALIGADELETQRATGEITRCSYNFLTRKLQTTKGNMSNDKMGKSIWSTFTLKELKTLETFQKPHTWDEFNL